MTDKKSIFDYQREADPTPEGTHTFLQWKGTDVCMDFHCKCGTSMHFDCSFLYFVECSGCNTRYMMSSYVRAIEVPAEYDEEVSGQCLWTTVDERGDGQDVAIRVDELMPGTPIAYGTAEMTTDRTEDDKKNRIIRNLTIKIDIP